MGAGLENLILIISIPLLKTDPIALSPDAKTACFPKLLHAEVLLQPAEL